MCKSINDLKEEARRQKIIASIIFAIYLIAFILSSLSVFLKNVPLSVRFNLSIIAFLLFLISVIGMWLD